MDENEKAEALFIAKRIEDEGHTSSSVKAARTIRMLITKMEAAQKDAARYQWLSRRVSGHLTRDGWAIGFPTCRTIPTSDLVLKDPGAALGEAIDAAMASKS